MSDFFENIGYAARRAVSTVSTEVNIAALEQKIKDAQRRLGQLYYDAVTNGNMPIGPEYTAQVEAIRQLQAEIDAKRRSHEVNR